MTYPVRGYAGAASAGTLSAALTSSATGSVASSASIASWNASSTIPLTSSVSITVAIDYGLATEEKVLAYYVDSTHINITARGVDGTTAQTHGAGAFFIPVWSAAEAQEAQNAVQVLKPILTNTGGATTPAVIGVDATAAVGTGQVVAPIDHVHNLPSTSLVTWLQSASLTATNLSVSAANLTGTLSTAQLANASNAWYTSISSGSVPSGTTFPSTPQISQTVTGFPSYLITFTCTVKNLDTAAGHNVLAEIGFGAGSATQIASTANTVGGTTGGTNTGFSTLACTYVVTGQTIATTYTVGGYMTIGGSTTGSVTNANLSIIGIA